MVDLKDVAVEEKEPVSPLVQGPAVDLKAVVVEEKEPVSPLVQGPAVASTPMKESVGDTVVKEMEVPQARAQSLGPLQGFGATNIKGFEGTWWDTMLDCASHEAQEEDRPLVILKSGLNICPDHSLELGVGTGVSADLFMPGQIGVEEEDAPANGQSGPLHGFLVQV